MLATDQKKDERGLSATSIAFLARRTKVIARWEREVRTRIEGASDLDSPILTNTLPAFYDNIAEALTPGYPREIATSNNNAAAVHGGERARMTPFGPDQIIHEYQILRESIGSEGRDGLVLTDADWSVIDRSINAAVMEAVRAYMEQYGELQRRLAAALSHDMRTPLAVIVNGAQLIGMAKDMAIVKRTAARIEANGKRLGEMMSELLDALTLRPGTRLPLALSQFDIYELVKAVSTEFADGDTGRIQVSGKSITGYWCQNTLRRAIENLTNNAFKYGDGGTIRIRIDSFDGRLLLTVHNSGVPIPEEQHNRIFNYLRREDSSRDTDGWGIGLPFVRSAAESHGGSVAVDSSAELGTTFVIDIPIDARPYVADSDDAQAVGAGLGPEHR
jgi:signal transduction histidine kinase